MDHRRFDALVRSFAVPRTRRGLLGALGTLAAGLFAARPAAAQVSQASCGNVTCASNPGKCKPGCVCCVYGNGNSRCPPPQECTGTVASPPTTTTTAAPTTTTTTAAPTTTTAAPTTTTATPSTTAAPATTTTAPPGTCGGACSPVNGVGCPDGCVCDDAYDGTCVAAASI